MTRLPHTDETARLAALDSLGLLDTGPEPGFDQFTALAQQQFAVPIVLFSLIGDRRQWLKSAQGLAPTAWPRSQSICAVTALGDDAHVIEDSHVVPELADHPLVTGFPHIRFYAGHPVKFRGYNIGTLALIDQRPRPFSDAERESLGQLARWIEAELEQRRLDSDKETLIRALESKRRALLIDPVTRVWNRAGMELLLAREIAQAQRQQETVGLILLRIHGLSQPQATPAATGADTLLRDIARRMLDCLRPKDLVGRHEQNTFVVFIANCSSDAATDIAARIQAKISQRPFQLDLEDVRLQAAAGIAVAAVSDSLDLGRLLGSAEDSLAMAEEQGDNGLETALLL